MLAAVVLWAVTRSPFTLMFAALGPVIAVASLADSRWSARRTARRAAAAFDEEFACAVTAVRAAHAAERAVLDDRHPPGSVLVLRRGADPARWGSDTAQLVLGRTAIPSSTPFDPPARADEPYRSPLAALADEAATLDDAPIVLAAATGVGVCGPRPLAQAVLRALAVQLAWSLSPGQWSLGESGEAWAGTLPHPPGPPPPHHGIRLRRTGSDQTMTLALADREEELPPGCSAVIVVGGGRRARIGWHPDPAVRGDVAVDAVTEREAAEWAAALRAEAARTGLLGTVRELPASIGLHELPPDAEPARAGLAAAFAVGAGGPLTIDLVEHGPHAVVGGTTGSGKSELLVAWVVALAARYPPSALGFLLVDFKGGSAFAALAALPHSTGTITDLDAAGALRALASLRAEVRYRERVIAAAGARDLIGARDAAGRPLLGRLVIMVDEFAAMLAEHPDLHALFADLAARGRSLGIHLVLCTQRPAGAVRDAVLANADLRISLRVNNRGDSTAVVGTDGAAAIPAESRGRALVALAGGDPEVVQFAMAGDRDLAAVVERWAGSEPARRPWIEPLPATVVLAGLPPAPGGPSPPAYVFGLLDRPDEQRREVACWLPARHGGLLVLGAAGAGTSTAIATVAESANARWLPRSAEAAWDVVDELVRAPAPGVLAIDDLDALFGRFPGDHRNEFAERMVRLAREGPADGLHIVASMRRIPGELQVLASLLPGRLLLRHASRQDLVLAGGDGARHDPALGPGSGTWLDARVQVAIGDRPRPADPPALVTPLPPGMPLAVVTTRAVTVADRLAALGYRIHPLLSTAPTEMDVPFAVVGDVDEWQSQWGALAALRPIAATVFDNCSPSDLRQLTRSRQLPPPLAQGQSWLLDRDGGVVRTVMPC
jgi:S-DNA-T family DNA segregation ATPase FtsK/SpoIIIE